VICGHVVFTEAIQPMSNGSPLLLSACLLTSVLLHAGEIPIVVKGDTGPALWPAPVKCGVPFPEGVYKADQPLLLVDQDGKTQIFQRCVTATWDPKGEKGVRWLLLDFLAERGKAYRLLFGEGAKGERLDAAPIGGVTDKEVWIKTGKLEARCSLNRLDLFRSIRFRNQKGLTVPAIADDTPSGPYIEHETRGVFRAELDEGASVVLEETGPIRSTVKADGWYTNEKGEKFCRYSIRLHFFRDKADVRIEHTFIFTGTSNNDRLRDIGIRLPLTGQPRQKGLMSVFGTMARDDVCESLPLENTSSHVYQVMDSPDHRRFEWSLRDVEKGRIIRHGVKAGGCVRAYTSQQSMMAVIRDAWQQYPFELELAGSTASVHLWPKHGRIWDTSFDGMWYYLTDRQKRTMVRHKPKVGEARFETVWKQLHESNALGAAKTHEVWLFFGLQSEWNVGTRQYWDRVHRPVYAHADLEWQCKTRALDFVPHHPEDMENFPHEENYLSTMLDLMRRHVKCVHYFGWWDWGAYHQHLPLKNPPTNWGESTFENTAFQPSWHRAKPKSHYYWGSFPWLMYFRTGDIGWLRYAQTYTLYSADMAFRHHTDEATGRTAGEEYHYDNSEIHWIGGWYGYPGGAIPMANICDRDDYIYQYWLTGDRRAWDILQMWAEQFDAQLNVGSKHLQMLVEGQPYGNWTRNIGGALNRLSSYYVATWDERFLKHADSLARLFRGFDLRASLERSAKDAEPNPQAVLSNTWYWNWLFEGLHRYYRATGDEEIRDALVDSCRVAADLSAGWSAGKCFTLKWCTYGCALTGDALFLDLGRRTVDAEMARWVRRRSFQPGSTKFRVVSLPRFIGAMASAPEDWKSRNLPMDRKGGTLVLLYYHPKAAGFPHWKNKTQPVYLQDEKDEPFTIHFAAYQGGVFALFGPDGRIAAEAAIDWRKNMRGTVQIPRDGKTGTYTLAYVRQLGRFSSTRWWDYPAHLTIIDCDLPKIVYPVSATPGGGQYFVARSWYFGVPAGAKGVEAHWRPNTFELYGQRDFSVAEAAGLYRRSTRDLTPVNNHGPGRYWDFNRYTFEIPPSDKQRIFRCELSCDRGRFSLGDEIKSGNGFVIIGAPPYVSTNPEAWFVPKLPAQYETPKDDSPQPGSMNVLEK